MKKIEFKNYEDSPTTPINAQALNAMQNNVEEAINNIAPNQEMVELTTDMNVDDLTESMIGFGKLKYGYNENAGKTYFIVIGINQDNCLQIGFPQEKPTEIPVRQKINGAWRAWRSVGIFAG